MNKPIVVVHKMNNEVINIPMHYSISVEEDIHTINCNVDLADFHSPAWLQVRKFQIRSRLINKSYSPLFSDDRQARNLDSVQFVDEAYREIMKMEHNRIEY